MSVDVLDMLLKQRDLLLADYQSLSRQLANDRAFNGTSKHKIKTAMRKIENELEDNQDLINREYKNQERESEDDMRETGFENGIDTRANQFGHVSSMVDSAASALLGKSAIKGGGRVVSKNAVVTSKDAKQQSNNMIGLIVAGVAIFLLSKK